MSGMASVHPADPINAKLAGNRYKMYLVEMDDDDRERVISGVIDNVLIDVDNQYSNVPVDALLDSARIFRTLDPIVTVTAKVVGGTLKYENFLEVDSEDEEEYGE